MDNLGELLGSVLSDPQAMSKIRSLGKELGLSTDADNTANTQPQKTQATTPDLSSLAALIAGNSQSNTNQSSSVLGTLSPEMLSSVTRLMPLLSSFSEEDETSVLLNSLRPFLSPVRRKRLDDAGKMLKVMKLLPKLRSTGIL